MNSPKPRDLCDVFTRTQQQARELLAQLPVSSMGSFGGSLQRVTLETVREIKNHIAERQPLSAVRLLRMATGFGLKEAHDFITAPGLDKRLDDLAKADGVVLTPLQTAETLLRMAGDVARGAVETAPTTMSVDDLKALTDISARLSQLGY